MIRFATGPGRTAARGLTVGGVFALVALSAAPRAPVARTSLPPLMLWAWERPSDLRDLPGEAGVAFLALGVHLKTGTIALAPRRQKLLVTPGTPLLAVTRIDASPSELADLTDDEIRRLATSIAGTAALPRVRGVQIDFDATLSQRPLYRRLLHEVRRQLGPEAFVSMTALASWCLHDGWLDGLPVDEVVPMLFRMGEGERVQQRIRAPVCRGALGIALDEPVPLSAPRTYVFNNRPWSAAAIADASSRGRR
jgi:hypothetical protein